jgi:hypothetical protein
VAVGPQPGRFATPPEGTRGDDVGDSVALDVQAYVVDDPVWMSNAVRITLP